MTKKNSEIISLHKDQSDRVHITIENLTLKQPQENTTLVDCFNLALKAGDHFIMTGPSGSGKSHLIRAIRGLVYQGTGSITLPKDCNILCLSQKVDLPRTSLKEILSDGKTFSEEEIDQALADVGHDKLRKYLPINQAVPTFLFAHTKLYIEMALNHWSKDIEKLSTNEKNNLTVQIQNYLQTYTQNFLPDEIDEHLDVSKKKEFSQLVTDMINEAFQEKVTSSNQSQTFFNLTGINHQKLAADISKYILQGLAIELKNMNLDGSVFSRQLSGGEQQRLMFAKILLHKPDILIMDETTSALDRPSGKKLYEKITKALPNTIIWSVAHDTNLIQCHNLHGELDGDTKKINIREISNPS